MPPLAASATSAPSVGSPISSPSLTHRVGGQHHRHQELVQRDLRLPGDAGDLARARVARALDRVAAADDRHLDRGHLVQRERPGLVRVDRRRRPEGLGRLQPLHDRAGLGQRLRAVRQDRRDHRGQVLRERADGEGDRGGEHHGELGAAGQVQRHRHDQRDPRDPQDLPGQPVELAGERRSCRPAPASSPEIWPTSVAIPVAVTTNSPDPRVTLVFMYTMSVRSPSGVSACRHRVGALRDRQALPGQRGLGDLQRGRPQQPAVRRHDVARLDRHDIAGDQLLGGDLPQLAVAHAPGR